MRNCARGAGTHNPGRGFAEGVSRRGLIEGSLGTGRDDLPADTSRQLALAAQPQPFFGFELRHPQEMVEHVEAMTTGQFDQFRNSLRNEGYGLVRAALLPPWLIGADF